jgi:hypothetical protein
MRIRINGKPFDDLDPEHPAPFLTLLDGGTPSPTDKIECWNYNTRAWQEVDYVRYANLVEQYNGEIDWSAYTVPDADVSDIEPGDPEKQAEAMKEFVVGKTWEDPVQPTARTIGKKLGGVRLSKEDMDFLKDMGIGS